MQNKKTNKVLLVTLGTLIILTLGSLLISFKIYDVIYLLAIVICLIRYKLMKEEQ